MDPKLAINIYQSITMLVVAVLACVLAIVVLRTRKPVLVSGKKIQYAWMIYLLPGAIFFLYWAVQIKSIGAAIMMLALYGLLYAMSKLAGDFLVYNISESLLRETIEDTLSSNDLPFEEGQTTGLLANTGKTKGRSIVTLYIDGTGSNVRYAFGKIFDGASVRVRNLGAIDNAPKLIDEMTQSLKSKNNVPGSTPWKIVAFGAVLAVWALFRLRMVV